MPLRVGAPLALELLLEATELLLEDEATLELLLEVEILAEATSEFTVVPFTVVLIQ